MTKKCNKCLLVRPVADYTKRLLGPKKDGSQGSSFKSTCKYCASILRVCKRYNITEELYHKLLSEQSYICKICGLPESTVDSRYGKVRTLSLDHCHKTKKIRGFLCEDCNRALGMLKDNILLFHKAVDYLKSYIET